MRALIIFLFSFPTLILTAQKTIPPGLQVTGMDGAHQELTTIIDGDLPVIITFWATWCKPCHEELTALSELQDEWLGKVRIVALSVDDARASAKVKSFVSGRRWPFEVFHDSNQNVKRSLNISDIPYVILVDRNGKIVYRHAGYTPGSESFLIEKAIQTGGK